MDDNGWFTTFLMYLCIFGGYIATPIKIVLRSLRWAALTHPYPVIATVLGGSGFLIAEQVFTGQLNPRIFIFVLVFVIIAFAAMVTAMVPMPARDPGVEFAPLK
jgi:hypothetical protein